jgi:hypothetical protein
MEKATISTEQQNLRPNLIKWQTSVSKIKMDITEMPGHIYNFMSNCWQKLIDCLEEDLRLHVKERKVMKQD